MFKFIWKYIVIFFKFILIAICAFIPGFIIAKIAEATKRFTVAGVLLGLAYVPVFILKLGGKWTIPLFIAYLLLVISTKIAHNGFRKEFLELKTVKENLLIAWGLVFTFLVTSIVFDLNYFESIKWYLVTVLVLCLAAPVLVVTEKNKCKEMFSLFSGNSLVMQYDFFHIVDKNKEEKEQIEELQKLVDTATEYAESLNFTKVTYDSNVFFLERNFFDKVEEVFEKYIETVSRPNKKVLIAKIASADEKFLVKMKIDSNIAVEKLEKKVGLLLGSDNIFEEKYSLFADLLMEKSNIKYDYEYEDEDYEEDDFEEDGFEDNYEEDDFEEDETNDIVIDINTCSENELSKVPLISRVMVIKAIEYRNKNNGFKDVDEFLGVIDIKPHMQEKVKRHIFCSENKKSAEDLKSNIFDEEKSNTRKRKIDY